MSERNKYTCSKISQNTAFCPMFSRTKTKCTIMSLCGKRQLREIPQFVIFYTVISYFQAYYQSYSITGNTTNSSCLDANRHYRKCRQDGPNPYYGSISFDNIAMAWVFIYQVISYLSGQFPARIYLIKVTNVNIRTMCEIYSKLTIKTPERRQWRHSGYFTVTFEQISHIVLVFSLLTLIK